MLIFTIGEKEKTYRELPEKSLEILLIKRGGYPFKDKWAIPGGFVGIREDIYEAAKRELKEETNIENVYMEQLYTWGEVERDPRMRVVSSSYMALVPKDKLDFKAGDDAKEARLFSVKLNPVSEKDIIENNEIVGAKTLYKLVLYNSEENITLTSDIKSIKKFSGSTIEETLDIISSDLAFDHSKIILYAIQRLRNKTEYTTIAFNLIGEKFTIGELQTVYSTILDKKYTMANFRRKIMPMLLEDSEMEENKGHRPAKYYKLNKYYLLKKG
jgi:ADP-ribose pyrophosphatase YjhB (NUDIX family)